MLSPDVLVDGTYIRPRAQGAPQYMYPFRKNGDRISAHFEQEYWQLKSTFVPQEMKIPHEVDPTFFLIGETQPEEFLAGLLRFKRTWSRVPAQQVVPGSRFVTKPDLPGTFPQVSGNSLIIQPEENVPRWVFYTHKAVTSDSGVPSGDHPTGGTYTVTVGSSTTAGVAFGASAATLQTAINGLASVSARGTVTVTGTYLTGLTITFDAYTAGTANTASLTGSGAYAGASTSVVVNGLSQVFTFNATLGGFSGGTFTVTVFGQTTSALAYNATAATVRTAVAALSNTSGCIVNVFSYLPTSIANDSHSVLYNATLIKFAVEVAPPTLTATSSLTPAGSTTTVAVAGSAGSAPYPNSYSLTLRGVNLGLRTLFSAGHGIAVTDGIIVQQGANYRTIAPSNYSVSTDTVTLTSASGVSFSDPTVITYVGSATGNVYTAGRKQTVVKRVTDYYLPGVTPGVTTIDDIPLPDYEGDDATLLAAIFSGDTDINYLVDEMALYMDGPIVQITRTTLDASRL